MLPADRGTAVGGLAKGWRHAVILTPGRRYSSAGFSLHLIVAGTRLLSKGRFLNTHILLPAHPCRLYLIRHGEVEDSYHRVFGGSRIDMGLSALGERQAQGLASWLDPVQIDAVYCSPMLRARRTAAPFVGQKGLVPVVMDDLREIDFGDWTGLTWEGVREQFGFSAYDWLSVLDSEGIKHGENAGALLSRVRPCVTRVLHENAHRNAAIVCHGGIVRVILAALLGLPLAKTAHFSVDYASVTIIEVQPGRKHGVEIDLLNWQPPPVAAS